MYGKELFYFGIVDKVLSKVHILPLKSIISAALDRKNFLMRVTAFIREFTVGKLQKACEHILE